MKKLKLLIIVFSTLFSLNIFAASDVVQIKAGQFLNILEKAIGKQGKILGRNNGTSGQACTFEIIRGEGRSSLFQSILRITETSVDGLTKKPVQINLFNEKLGYYGIEKLPDATYQYFAYTMDNINYEISVASTDQKDIAVTIAVSMGQRKVEGYCYAHTAVR
jgi:hypothetical protein